MNSCSERRSQTAAVLVIGKGHLSLTHFRSWLLLLNLVLDDVSIENAINASQASSNAK